MKLEIKRLHSDAQLPSAGSALSAGFDLFSIEPVVIPPLRRAVVSTGLAIRVPDGTYGRVAPRSGHAVKKGLDVMAGVIDADYTGEVGVVLHNTDPEESVFLDSGSKVAQLVIERIERPQVVEVDSLSATERGDGGYGSTGD